MLRLKVEMSVVKDASVTGDEEYERVTNEATAWLNNELCVRKNQMQMMTNESAQKMENLDATNNRLKGELGDTQVLLKEKTETLTPH